MRDFLYATARPSLSMVAAWRAPLVIVLAVSLTACFWKKKEEPAPSLQTETIRWVISADSQLNPDENGRPSPVLVRLYQLKSISGFAASDFFSIYEDPDTVLAKDMSYSEERILAPGQTLEIEAEAGPSARYLAAVVAYRDIQKSTWRATVDLTSTGEGPVLMDIGPNRVSFRAAAPQPAPADSE